MNANQSVLQISDRRVSVSLDGNTTRPQARRRQRSTCSTVGSPLSIVSGPVYGETLKAMGCQPECANAVFATCAGASSSSAYASGMTSALRIHLCQSQFGVSWLSLATPHVWTITICVQSSTSSLDGVVDADWAARQRTLSRHRTESDGLM